MDKEAFIKKCLKKGLSEGEAKKKWELHKEIEAQKDNKRKMLNRTIRK